jgi:diguanylate cyclase (GGDEF)-like protein
MDIASLLYVNADERSRLTALAADAERTQLVLRALLLVPLLVAVPVYGWIVVVPPLLAVAGYGLARLRLPADSVALLFGSLVSTVLAALAVLVVAHGPVRFLFCVAVFPMLLGATFLGRKAVAVSAGVAMLGLVAVALFVSYAEVGQFPPAVIFPALLLFVLALRSGAARDIHRRRRDDAVVDELTRLLNRSALEARAVEIPLLSRRGERVAVIVGDIDHFKNINDTRGHAVGDTVLREAANRLRVAAGEETVFRFGGEEFVLLLRGTDEHRAVEMAERLRDAVAAVPIANRTVRMSFGVAVTPPGTAFDYHALFPRADAALYSAKRSGRNRTHVAPAISTAPAPSPELAADEVPAGAPAAAPASASHSRRPGFRMSAIETAHALESTATARGQNRLPSALVLLCLLASAHWLGWLTLIPTLCSVAVLDRKLRSLPQSTHIERDTVVANLLMFSLLGLAIAIAGPRGLVLLPLTSITIFGVAGAYPPRIWSLTALIGVANIVVVGFIVDAPAILANPAIVAMPVALMLASAAAGSALGGAVRRQRELAVRDRLTGTLNRTALEARVLSLAHVSAHHQQRAIGLLVLDLDRFKAVNDRHGHEIGDRVLVEVANRAREQLRSSDSLYRIGGEEFLVILEHVGESEAMTIAERIREAVGDSPVGDVSITVSVGFTVVDGDSFDYDAAFVDADEALLRAKRSGRDRVCSGRTMEVADVAA